MTFQLNHHNRILTILNSLNSHLLEESKAYFGGGTLLTLDFGEYRWSKDIDFICPIASSGYKHLRTIIFDGGYQALFHDRTTINIQRGTTSQYGIRLLIIVENEPIKMEIIVEARFQIDPPRYPDWSPVACLSLDDCFTSKLLSNSDRYMDDSVEGRDLIDLAVLRLQSPIPQNAIEKAEKAYEVIRPLKEAIKRFQQREEYREKWFSSLQVNPQQIPRIIDGIDCLASDFDLPTTERTFKEQRQDFY